MSATNREDGSEEAARLAPLLVIVGPTGAGKSELALRAADFLHGEIVSADSQQVYRGMDIGTGKASADDQGRVPHHLLDVLEPSEEMSAARFVELADGAIKAIHARGKVAVVAGGTMLYVRALLWGLFEGPAADTKLRSELALRGESQGLEVLWREMAEFDPLSAEKIHKTDLRRIIRATEVYRNSGIPLSEHHRRHRAQPARYASCMVGVAPERDLLYQQIDSRVLGMMQNGLLEEVQGLRGQGFTSALRSQQAIGYREMHEHLGGALELEDAVTLVQRNSRRYARRQLSWYRGQEGIRWFRCPSEVDLGELGGYLASAI